MPYRNSPLNPNARKVGKRSKNPSDSKDGKKGGSDVPYELDPKAVKSYQAFCGDCGSLGMFLNPGDAQNAENVHRQRKHSDTVNKPTTSVTQQNKRNKGQGGKK